MSYLESRPKRPLRINWDKMDKLVRLNFGKPPKDKPHYSPKLNIYIGKEILEQLQWAIGDRVVFYMHDTNFRHWVLKKVALDDPLSYRVARSGDKENYTKVQLSWRFTQIELIPSDYVLKEVPFKLMLPTGDGENLGCILIN